MPTYKQSSGNIYFVLGLSGLLAVLVFDRYYWHLNIFRETWPNFTGGHLVRSAVIILSVCILCWGTWQLSVRRNGKSFTVERWSTFERSSILTCLLMSLAFLVLILVSASRFSNLSLEDHPVEWASAGFLFVASALLMTAFLKASADRQWPLPIRGTLVLFSLSFLFIGLEETSWFQRVFQFRTPDPFFDNAQGESNLHNFATDKTENAYYFGAFVFLVVLPFMRSLRLLPFTNRYFELFVPRAYLLCVGTIACAYNFDMWNTVFTQVEFFGALAILVTYALICVQGFERVVAAGTAVLIAVTQIVFLSRGESFARLYEVTEYKELLIPLGFALFALDVYRRVDKPNPR